jgi:hypothetical protein
MYKNLDIKAYNEAKRFLLENTPDVVTEDILTVYLNVPSIATDSITINNIYGRLLESAQNANMKAGVIGGSIGGVENLSIVLFDFNPKRVLAEYKDNTEALLDTIVSKLKPVGKIRRTPKSIWPKYCKTIVSAAEFISQFATAQDFFEWANYFYKDQRSFAALPMLLEAEIYGIAFPLACDFLKELGYVDFGKPDVHIIEQFEALGLIKEKSSNYQVLKAITRISEHVGVSAYNVDKVFWLIGSGYFYHHLHIGNEGRVGRMKDAFIKYWNST